MTRSRKRAPASAPRARLAFPLDEVADFTVPSELPLLPLRDVVLFPGMVVPLLVGRPASVVAVERALAEEKLLLVTAQTDPQDADPSPGELHSIGVVVRLLQVIRPQDGTAKILVEGLLRARIESIVKRKHHARGRISLAEPAAEPSSQMKAQTRSVVSRFQEYVRLNKRIPDEVLVAIGDPEDARRVANIVAGHLLIPIAKRQALLEARDVLDQLRQVARVLSEELEILRLEKKIEGEVKSQVVKGQKEFYLQEQLKAIRKELGESSSDDQDVDELRASIEAAGMPAEIRVKALREVERLTRMSPMSPEATVVRTYVETLVGLPWSKRTRDRIDLRKARQILDEDHFGLEKIKERILEYLAVVKLMKSPRGSILCLVGPPGVGKTSLGRSVARALGRKFVRVSLGGVRDEAEIRGHRRTYIGSMPGRIILGMKRAGTRNPVFLLDEIDKLGADFRGDPSAALLEVLDPEQNSAFNDHYLDVDFDLSEVIFLTTANVLQSIPPALRDRMEILRLPGYLHHEKVGIARRFLLPKQTKQHGLDPGSVELTRPGLHTLLSRYTREAGVRNLEREIASICRKAARAKVEGRAAPLRIGPKTLEKLLGPPRFPERRLAATDRVGIASGLAWTEAGGDVLPVEVMAFPGSGKLALTGRLGEVMRESARIALSFAKSRAGALGLSAEFADHLDLHLHMPEGAIPKDGPSAGVCIAVAVVSALTRVPVRRDVAMTGEITLLGEVLPIGGLNEKVVAAQLAGFTRLLLPRENESDWQEIPAEARRGLTVVFVQRVDEVLCEALAPSPLVDRLVAASAASAASAMVRGMPSDGLPGIAH